MKVFIGGAAVTIPHSVAEVPAAHIPESSNRRSVTVVARVTDREVR
jgi:hypothetical protein